MSLLGLAILLLIAAMAVAGQAWAGFGSRILFERGKCLKTPQNLSYPPHSLSGFVFMFHRYDYISLFLSCFDIPVSLSNLFQRIAAINHRFYLPRLYKFFEEK